MLARKVIHINNLRVWILMGLLSVILVLLGNAINGPDGAILFFLIAVAMNFFSYFYSDRLAIKMTRSQPISEKEAPEIYEIIRKISGRAGIPMPRVYRTPSPQPNAFATGRNPEHSAVAITDGLVRLLNRDEIEGVLAHEIGHIKNRDILLASIAATFAGAITMIANVMRWGVFIGGGDDEGGGNVLGLAAMLLMSILAPLAAVLIQLAISRSREYGADATGARLAGSPDGLASALLRMEGAATRVPMDVNPATSHLFIVNPLSGQSFAKLFSTHPPIAERVKRLKAMNF